MDILQTLIDNVRELNQTVQELKIQNQELLQRNNDLVQQNTRLLTEIESLKSNVNPDVQTTEDSINTNVNPTEDLSPQPDIPLETLILLKTYHHNLTFHWRTVVMNIWKTQSTSKKTKTTIMNKKQLMSTEKKSKINGGSRISSKTFR